MNIPDDAEQFIESVLNTTKQLIELGFWDVERSRLDSWWKQFCGVEEEFFAACLLDRVIFRSRPQFEAALRSLFRSNLNRSIFKDKHDGYLVDTLSSRSNEPKIRLVPVICESDPPTKSGPLVIRRLQRILRLNPKWMCWPWQASDAVEKEGVDTVIFVDDFLGSGGQFKTFFDQWQFGEPGMSKVRFFYAPVVAHEKGIDHLSTELPRLRIAYIESLGSRQQFFSDETWDDMSHGSVTALDAKNWYLEFARKRKIAGRKIDPLGYEKLELTYGFSHSTPNNSLPILWSTSANWNPLLER